MGRHEVWQQAVENARSALSQKSLPRAQSEVETALGEAIRFPAGDPRIQHTLKTIGGVADLCGSQQGAKASIRYLDSVRMRAESLGGKSHEIVLQTLSEIGRRLSIFGDQSGAEEAHRQARRRAVEALGPGHPVSIQAAIKLSEVVAKAGRLEEAHELAGEARRNAEDAFGPHHPMCWEATLGMATVLAEERRYEEALGLVDEVDALAVEKFGPYHRERTRLFGLRAALSHHLYRYAQSIEYGEDAVKILQINGITGVPELGNLYGGLANAARGLDDLPRAEAWAEKGLSVFQELYGERAQQLVQPLILLSEIAADRGQLQEAKEHLQRAIAIAGGALDPAVKAKGLLSRLAEVVGAQGNESEADSLFDIAIPAARAGAMDEHSLGKQLIRFASYQTQRGRFHQAEPIIEEAMGLLDRPDTFRGPVFIRGLHVRALVQQELQRPVRAKELYQRALKDGEEVFGSESSRLIPVLQDYAELLATTGEEDEAKALRDRVTGIQARREAMLAGAGSGSKMTVVENLNLRLAEPPLPWVSIDPKGFDPNARLAYYNPKATVWATVNAVVLSPDSLLTTQGWVKAVKSSVRATRGDLNVDLERELTLAGVPGRLLHARSLFKGKPLQYRIWVSVHRGFAYQLAIWAPEDAAQFEVEAGRMFGAFSPIDAERLAPGWEILEHGYESPLFGYRVELRSDDLRPQLSTRPPLVDFSAVRGGGSAGLMMMAFSLLGTQPEPAAIDDTLESFLAAQEFKARKPVARNGLAGTELEFSRDTDRHRLAYRCQLLHGDGRAFALCAWRDVDSDSSMPALERVDFASARPPAEVSSLDDRDRRRHAELVAEIGRWEASRSRPEPAAELLHLATRLSPDEAVLHEELIADLIAAEQHAAAEKQIDLAMATFETDGRFPALRGLVQHRTGRIPAAIRSYEQALALGYQDANTYSGYVHALVEGDRAEEALERLEHRIAETGSTHLQQLKVEVLQVLGRLEDAIEELRLLAQTHPGDIELRYSLAELYIQLEQGEQALALCNELEKTTTENARLQAIRANAFYRLARYREAQDAMRRAVELDPSYPGAQDFIRVLAQLTGQGENEPVRRPIEAVPTPETAQELPEPRTDLGDSHGAYYLSLSRVFRVDPGAPLRQTDRAVVHVTDRRGVARFSSLRFRFDPDSEAIFVNEVVVRNTEGDVISRTDTADSYVLDDPNSGMAVSEKILNVPVRGLRPGTRIEMTLTRERLTAAEQFDFESMLFAREIPAVRVDLFVAGEVENVGHWSRGAVQHRAGPGLLHWWMGAPPTAREEVLQQPPENYLPRVALASRGGDWEALGKKYLADIETPLANRDSATKLARSLAGEDKDPAVIARRLTSYVQEQLRYEAIEFGLHAWVPHEVSSILDKRYGDCKDHALLLQQMLESMGIASHLALVRTKGPLVEELPALTQFDHMIVYCAGCAGGGRFIDPTDKDGSPAARVPRGFGGLKALILDPKGPRLTEIPYSDEQLIETQRVVSLKDDGSAMVQEQVHFAGDASAWIRSILTALDRSSWEASFFHPIVTRGLDVEFYDIEASNLDPNTEDVELSLRYSAHKLLSPAGDRIAGTPPAIWEELFLGALPVPERHTPFRLPTPLRLRSRIELLAPDSHRFLPLDRVGMSGENRRFHAWSGATQAGPEKVVIEMNLNRVSGDFPASAYAQYAAEAKSALQELRTDLVLERRP